MIPVTDVMSRKVLAKMSDEHQAVIASAITKYEAEFFGTVRVTKADGCEFWLAPIMNGMLRYDLGALFRVLNLYIQEIAFRMRLDVIWGADGNGYEKAYWRFVPKPANENKPPL